MPKLTSQFKLNEDQLTALKQIIPEAFKDGMVDIGALSDALSDYTGKDTLDIDDNLFGLYWPGKKAAKRTATVRPVGTLVPVLGDGVDEDTTKNIYIEGDNLEVLKIIRKAYKEKVKMIYIDPPYNTGNDFIYNDDFSETDESYQKSTGQIDEKGIKLSTNSKSDGRFHSKWLTMMYPRLRLARDLLTDDGVIFISIDDNEVDNLLKICEELFGTENYQATITYVRKTSGKQDSTNFMKSTEYVVVYSKSPDWDCAPIIATERILDRYNKYDETGKQFRETDLRKTGNSDRREDRPLMWYPFYFNPSTNDLQVKQETDISLIKKGYIEIYPIKPDRSEGRWRWGFQTASSNLDNLVARIMPKYKDEEKYTIYEMDFIDKKGDVRTVKEHTSWDRKEFNSDNAMLEFKKLGFSNQLFPFPKSSALIKHMIYLANDNKAIILDFFSGSSTTAQAVMQLNAEDNGNRQYIMVQLPELCKENSEAAKAGFKNICEIGKERIRLAGKKIKQEADANAKNLDIGFKVFRLAPSNIKQVKPYTGTDVNELQDWFSGDTLVEDFKTENLITEVMLKEGFPLDSTIAALDIYKKNKVFQVSSNFCKHSLIICFDKHIENDTVEKLDLGDLNIFVCRDSAISDQVKSRLDDKGRIITI